jgi:hypothetical protein
VTSDNVSEPETAETVQERPGKSVDDQLRVLELGSAQAMAVACVRSYG